MKGNYNFQNGSNINFDAEIAETISVFRALKNPLRMKIMQLLDGKEGMKVTDIYTELRIEQSVASNQLAILRKAGIVRVERFGKEKRYSLSYKRLEFLQRIALQVLNNK
jgi:DNA-binding transcriptional ArsR family regulator